MSELQTMIDDCETRSSRLSDWEASFIDSISKQYAETGGLSDKQQETLESIWDKATEAG